jgi:hypothetical protein
MHITAAGIFAAQDEATRSHLVPADEASRIDGVKSRTSTSRRSHPAHSCRLTGNGPSDSMPMAPSRLPSE